MRIQEEVPMFGTILGSRCVVMLLVLGLLWAGPALAQTPEEPDTTDVEVTLEGPAAPVNPPPFVVSLLDATDLTPEQLEQMRTDGAGWGNIRIAVLLAERIAADSEGATTFDEALAAVLAARAEGLGFGEIAGEEGLKIGALVRNRNRNRQRVVNRSGRLQMRPRPNRSSRPNLRSPIRRTWRSRWRSRRSRPPCRLSSRAWWRRRI